MKFGSWTYNLDDMNLTGNKTGQIEPKIITGHSNDGLSEELFENNGVIILRGNMIIIVIQNILSIFFDSRNGKYWVFQQSELKQNIYTTITKKPMSTLPTRS